MLYGIPARENVCDVMETKYVCRVCYNGRNKISYVDAVHICVVLVNYLVKSRASSVY